MMKRLVMIAALALPCARAGAEESELKLAVSGDVLAPGNQLKHLRDSLPGLCRSIAGTGAACASSYKSYVSAGGRLTVYEQTGNTRFAASLGALNGGPNRGKVKIDAAAAAGSVTLTRQSTVIRALAGMGHKFPLGGSWALSF